MASSERLAALERWIAGLRTDVAGPLAPASVDASFRRYFRVPVAGGSLVAMDAPPAHEDVRPFVDVARRLAAAGIHVPEILAVDAARGFLLMTDLGTTGYMDRLGGDDPGPLYDDAIAALVRMQARTSVDGLPVYDAGRLGAELDLFPAWYVRRHLGLEPPAPWWRAWRTTRETLIESALAQPRVFVHRDYMPRNLMVSAPNPGVLDFQDAVAGPLTYDPVSLIRDAFVSWPPAVEERLLEQFRAGAADAGLPVPDDAAAFRRDADRMAAQRHLKVLGIFARLRYRDGKAHYIADAPRFRDYLARASGGDPGLSALRELLEALPAEPAAP